ncbi:MAG: deoxyguanosinetriphosphate triphosphohydrolase [Coriobacteriia bacterium]|nr:deoxyguanosinetriphosphate triphosphohydrolase [Coriobacteriia bacterium]
MEIMTREEYEAEEHRLLSPRAAFSDASRGRERPMEPDPLRSEFQRDRDRIIHCKAFRRLSHKTQVFLAPEGDHYRTRLTHTLEVAQIARSIARALRLNEDLTEAVALGHDLGHTPFGHIGEDALNDCLAQVRDDYPSARYPFRHNLQSLRLVEELEYDGKGLNLTWEVRDGIHHHTGSGRASTLEGQIVAIADRIAYVNHDIDDAIRGGVLTEADLPLAPTDVLGHAHGARITTMVQDMVSSSLDSETIRMSEAVWKAMMDLRSFLFDHVYLSESAKAEEPKAYRIVQTLFWHFLEHPEDMYSEAGNAAPAQAAPAQAVPARATLLPDEADLPDRVTDYIAGMTDRFAIRTYEKLFLPKSWMV